MSTKSYTIACSSTNPFSDSQARNYSDDRVVTEFCPISNFWSLFNDQHEVLIGTRGCGKTILLKMMRYSMLNKLSDPKAKKIIAEKKYVAFYVPLHLEYIKILSTSNCSMDSKISWFRFAFNCALAQSILIEVNEILKDLYNDELYRIKKEYELAKVIDLCWMINDDSPVFQLSRLRDKIDTLFYSTDPFAADLTSVPNTFIHSLGSSLSSISNIIGEKLCISPTWIVCIDEAEFLDECYQKCINTAFRSDTGRIAFKMATLPFYHKTRRTLDDEIDVMVGQDYKCTFVDMSYDKMDFINVTNSLVKTRLRSENININRLEEFVETLGKDSYIDYYLNETGEDEISEQLSNEILNQLSDNSRKFNQNKSMSDIRKPVINKLAPVFYVREMYKQNRGRHIPGWFAGAKMIRRVAQGNPRIFIRLMNELFDGAKGRKLPLSIKIQSRIVISFANSFCNETQTLEQSGPEANKHLEYISQIIHDRTHKSDLISCGTSFKLSKNTDIAQHRKWIERAVAFSRLVVDENTLKTQPTNDTVFCLANVYAVKYWLPIRTNFSPIVINLNEVTPFYTITRASKRKAKTENSNQVSIFDIGEYVDDYK